MGDGTAAEFPELCCGHLGPQRGRRVDPAGRETVAPMVKLSDASVALQNRKVFVFENVEEMSDFAVKKWREIATTAIKDRGRFAVALSGGTTPVNLYRRLAGRSDLPWGKTHIFLVDERFVPLDHPDSNYRMIWDTLLSRVGIVTSNIHPIPTEANSSRAAAREYEEDLRRFFLLGDGELPRFNLILLGIGEDGHTASLFPGTSSLEENERLAIAVRGERVTHERVSITFPVINSAENVILLVIGPNKATVVRKILVERSSSLPAGPVQPDSGALFFLLDKDSAVHLVGHKVGVGTA